MIAYLTYEAITEGRSQAYRSRRSVLLRPCAPLRRIVRALLARSGAYLGVLSGVKDVDRRSVVR